MSNTFFQGGAKFFSGKTKHPRPLLVTGLIIGNDFFVFNKFALPQLFFCLLPYRRSGVPVYDAPPLNQGRSQVSWRPAQESSLAPHVRAWGLSEANGLYWRKYLWHFWDFSAPPIVIRRPWNCAPPRYAPALNAILLLILIPCRPKLSVDKWSNCFNANGQAPPMFIKTPFHKSFYRILKIPFKEINFCCRRASRTVTFRFMFCHLSKSKSRSRDETMRLSFSGANDAAFLWG